MPLTNTAVIPIPYRVFRALAQAKQPTKTALVVDKTNYSYAQMRNLVLGFARYISKLPPVATTKPIRIAILSHRELFTYQAILGSIVSATTYVPLNTTFPVEKSAHIAEHCEATHLCISPQAKHIQYAKHMLEHMSSQARDNLQLICTKEAATEFGSLVKQENLHLIESFSELFGKNLLEGGGVHRMRYKAISKLIAQSSKAMTALSTQMLRVKLSSYTYSIPRVLLAHLKVS